MKLKINFLDHIAITVNDLETSAQWYEHILGLKRYVFEKEWGPFPVFMLAGKSGLALFPAKKQATEPIQEVTHPSMKHFAFNVDTENFENAKHLLKERNISFEYQDHFFFDSIYFRDPDGYLVELTTPKVDKKSFFRELD